MKLQLSILALIFLFQFALISQEIESPCSKTSILKRMNIQNPNASEEQNELEEWLQSMIRELEIAKNGDFFVQTEFVIPVVMHVFHWGDDGKMGMEQALSGLQRLNEDFHGLNDGWETIDPLFESRKGSLNITFCLATIDPEGLETTGIIYHEDSLAVYNQGDLFQHAWDNYKYLNIYFPKYTSGGPSNFTGYAYFPSTFNSNNNEDGIFYSSIRWGFGEHSVLENEDDWASVCTHEAGHWLNLYHTFEGGCSSSDNVGDTPPTTGGSIFLEGCNNNDFSCGQATNGENFMDYNHRCKKMFTQGQIARMNGGLYHPTRQPLWSEENLISTGCIDYFSSNQEVDLALDAFIFPNPTTGILNVRQFVDHATISILNVQGIRLESFDLKESETSMNVEHLQSGLYYYMLKSNGKAKTGKFFIAK